MITIRQFATASLISLLMSGAAHAALTADQVWAEMQAQVSLVRGVLQAEGVQKDGAVLTLSNVTLGDSAASDDQLRIPEITITEMPDGSVTLGFAPQITLDYPLGGKDQGKLTVDQQGLQVIVQEEAGGARIYDFAAQSLNIVSKVTTMVPTYDEANTEKPSTFDLAFDFAGVKGSYSDTPGANRAFSGTLNADHLRYTLDQSDLSINQTSQQINDVQDIQFSGGVTMPAGMDMTTMTRPAQMADALRAGFAANLRIVQGASTSDQSMSSEFLTYTVKSVTAGGDANLSFDKTGFVVSGGGGKAEIDVTSPELPIPAVNIVAGGAKVELRIPTLGGSMQDFRYMVSLDGLTANEEAWAMIDPTAKLPRDPVSVAVDVTGRADIDMFALVQAEDDGSVPPIPQIESLKIAMFQAMGAGVAVDATGAFTFDNATGVPMPRGAADVTVKGANRMIDALVAMQLLPADQVLSTRMALALFLKPTDVPDEGISKLEARDDGGFYVNGQRMQ
jgi:hypothetical protein